MHQIVTLPLSKLKEAAQNSRVHTAEQINQIAASIQRFGWTIPVLVDDEGMIIAGHARVRAGRQLGMTEAPCIVATGWDDDQKEAYQIADNRLGEMSNWDKDILSDQIKRLTAVNFDLGFLDMGALNLDLDGFMPTLDPKINTAAVTGEQVAAAQGAMQGQFTPEASGGATVAKPTYGVVCPHCGGEFDVSL